MSCHSYYATPSLSSQTVSESPIPSTAVGFWDFYGVAPPPPGLQRGLVGFIGKSLYSTELIKNDNDYCTRARLLSNSAKSAGLWLTTLPLTPELTVSDTNFRLGARFRLGLPPQDDLPKQCHCGTLLASDPAHFLSCQSFRRYSVTHRHHSIVQLLGRLVRMAGGSICIEPHWMDGKRYDAHIVFPDTRIATDATVTHPGSPSYRQASASIPLHAAIVRQGVKVKKYGKMAQDEDSKFLAFVMESFGGLGPQAKVLLGEIVRQYKESAMPSVFKFRDYATRALNISLLNGNCFVLRNGCLKLREWDGKHRRDRRRQASRYLSDFVFRPVRPAPAPLSPPAADFTVTVPAADSSRPARSPGIVVVV